MSLIVQRSRRSARSAIAGTGTAVGYLIVGVIGCGAAFLLLRASVKNALRLRGERFAGYQI